MALAIVQTTPRVRALSTLTVAITFSTRPTVGNALVIPVVIYCPGLFFPVATTCVDNQGNVYTLSIAQANNNTAAAIFLCAKVATASGTFTVTLTQPFTSWFETCAIEVSGVGAGLVVDQTIGVGGVSTTPTTGATAALTHDDVLIVSALAAGANQTFITVQSVSPVWVQAFENLDHSTSVAGEADQRLLTGVLGTTQTCAWTMSTVGSYGAVLAAFAAPSGPTPPAGGGGATKAKLGNKHGRTDENGAVIVAVGATPGTPGVIGPLTVFPHLCGETTATGLQVTSVTAGALRTPRTPLGNLRVTTDDQGSLRVASVTAGVIGPLTDLGNLLCRTDETGALIVTSSAAGSLTSAPSPLLNLRGRTDDQGALVVTGLSNPLAYQQRILADGAAAYWPLNDAVGSTTAKDLAGPRDATIPGTGVTLGQPGPGIQTSMLFDGASLLIPPSYPLQGLSITLECWINPSAIRLLTTYVLAHSIFGDGDWALSYQGPTSGNLFNIRFFQGSAQLINVPAVLTIGTWLYLVVVFTGTQVQVYLNGVGQGLNACLTGGADGGPPGIAGSQENTPASWQGRMADVAVYQKVLAASDITAHFALRTAL